MKHDKTKLVAYANGELQGREAEEIALLLAKDPEAAAYVDEVRALSLYASADLGKEPLPQGEGSSAILKKIARRQNAPLKAAAKRQAWIQAGAIALVVVLLFAAIPLKKKFFGQTAGMLSSNVDPAVTPDEENPEPRTAPVAKENPLLVKEDLEEVAARKGRRTEIPRCRFTLPAVTSIDKTAPTDRDTGLEHTYVLGKSGATLTLTVTTGVQPLVKVAGMEEVSHEAPYFLYRQLSESPLAVSFTKVHEKIQIPFCRVATLVEGKLSSEARQLAAGVMESMAARVAESMELK